MKRIMICFVVLIQGLQAYSQCAKPGELLPKDKYSKLKTTGYSYKDGVEIIDHIRTSSFDKKGRERSYIFQHITDSLKKTRNENFFDAEGNMIREIRRGTDGNIEDSLHYKYDDRGNMIECAMWRGGSFDSYSIFEYDENCNRTAYIAYQYDSSLWFHYADKYDANNNLVSSTDVSHTGETENYIRNDKGEILRITVTDSEGKVLSEKIAEIQHDKKGNPTLILWKDEAGNLVGKEEHSYKKNILIESKFYENDELIAHKVYDKMGNLTLSLTYANGNLTWKTTYEYEYYK